MSDALSMVLTFAVTGVVLAGAGVLTLWLARRSAQGLLKRNQIAGVRTSLTLSSDAAWYPAQRAAAPRARIAGWGAVVGGVAIVPLTLWGLRFDATMLIYTILTLGSVAWLIGWVLAGAATAQRAAQNAIRRPLELPDGQ